ncbi:peptide-methionine (S)-S-oxide reductase MsrA [Arvimicrobium flavum]|uniref:peptide-methionine (S)-S-oxide reductase MsrA n=1 Tax=Arvimicrobium flavum TaxID=3393320 RepID=UPI00237B09D0|nr:peptide-methionine (S)-S-oxide reductase MsrA [Mesorhizobium shangrilense]
MSFLLRKVRPAHGAWATIIAIGMLAFGASTAMTEEGIAIPAPSLDEPASQSATETAVLAGGCFWGVQGVFQRVRGVENAVSGYAGGAQQTAVYEIVGSGATGHAEAVKISYDPQKISYGKLLQVYFSVAHDPTQLNRQGPDKGTQYRSTIFAQNAAQAKIAEAYIAQLEKAKTFKMPIVTTIESGKAFYAAEDYHQDFLTLHPDYPYIVYVDLPKVENLKRLFPKHYSDDPALVSEASASN